MSGIIESAMKGPDRYESFISTRFQREKGCIVLGECVLCGWLEWRMTRSSEPDGHAVEPLPIVDCPRCNLIISRSPETFDWISGVVSSLCRDIQKRLPDNGNSAL